MYQSNGTYYTEEHSISFGNVKTITEQGKSYDTFDVIANTWTDWHLIPSSRPSVVPPTIVTKYVEIPGSDGVLDLSNFLTGRPTYGQRQGSFSFIVDNDHEQWEKLRSKITNALHGKKLNMRLEDDPNYFYTGRFTVGNWETGSDHSTVSLSYQLDPYKLRVASEGSVPLPWDPFNFNTDYDYYTTMGDYITVSGTPKDFTLYITEFSLTPIATWVSGSVSVEFGGSTVTLSSAGSKQLPALLSGLSNTENAKTLRVNGNGSVIIKWRGGSL